MEVSTLPMTETTAVPKSLNDLGQRLAEIDREKRSIDNSGNLSLQEGYRKDLMDEKDGIILDLLKRRNQKSLPQGSAIMVGLLLDEKNRPHKNLIEISFSQSGQQFKTRMPHPSNREDSLGKAINEQIGGVYDYRGVRLKDNSARHRLSPRTK